MDHSNKILLYEFIPLYQKKIFNLIVTIQQKEFEIEQMLGSFKPRSSRKYAADGFNSEIAKKQASRCFGCGRAFEKNQTCWYCLPCELECPQGALEVKIPYLVR